MFENKKINDVHATRFIMSWVRSGGILGRMGKGYGHFEQWLKSLKLSDDEIKYIVELARNGKMELETSAEVFIENINKNQGRYDWRA